MQFHQLKRREFIALLSGVAVASCGRPLAAFAQTPAKRPRIAFLGGSGSRPSAKSVAAFIEAMRALGYSEGREFEM